MRLRSVIRVLTMGLFFAMLGCREAPTISNAEKRSTADEPIAFLVNDESRVMMSGDSQQQTFVWQIHHDNVWTDASKVIVQRLDSPKSPAPWSFSPTSPVHVQDFQEEQVAYTLSTGILRSKRLLFHRIRCDHPGLLQVRATLDPFTEVGPKQIISRASPASQMWLIPFESEVTAEGDALVIRGEGELLLLWHWPQEDLITTWQSLLKDYDPAGGEHPNIAKIADLLQQEAAQQKE